MAKLKLKNNKKIKKLSLKNLELIKSETPVKHFINSGSNTLNLALTQDINKGYPLGRFINIVGNYSSGKTLLAAEAVNSVWFINHMKEGKKVHIVYDDPEFAFDFELAEQFNMPLDKIKWVNSRTVEKFHRNLYKEMKENSDKDIVLYILDSLDSISDEAEAGRIEKSLEEDKKEEASYGSEKAKYISKMFRHLVGDISKTNCLLIIISQIRDNIGGGLFGPKQKRSGGKALDFYASQVIWLKELGTIESNSKIVQGIKVEALVRKNKVAPPRRKAIFNIIHGYGADNVSSMIDFCVSAKELECSKKVIVWEGEKYREKDFIKYLDKNPKELKKLKKLTQKVWTDLENEARLERLPKWQ